MTPCRKCRRPLDRGLALGGEVTHPACDPAGPTATVLWDVETRIIWWDWRTVGSKFEATRSRPFP